MRIPPGKSPVTRAGHGRSVRCGPQRSRNIAVEEYCPARLMSDEGVQMDITSKPRSDGLLVKQHSCTPGMVETFKQRGLPPP